MAVEKRVGWGSGTRLGVDHSEAIGPSPTLARGLTLSVGLSVWQGAET